MILLPTLLGGLLKAAQISFLSFWRAEYTTDYAKFRHDLHDRASISSEIIYANGRNRLF